MKKIMKNFAVMSVTAMMLFTAKPADAAYLVQDLQTKAEIVAGNKISEVIKTGTLDIKGIVGDTYGLFKEQMTPLEQKLADKALDVAFGKKLDVGNLLNDVVDVVNIKNNRAEIKTAIDIIANSRSSDDIKRNVADALTDVLSQNIKQKKAIEDDEIVIMQSLDAVDKQLAKLATEAGDPQASQKKIAQCEAEMIALDSKKKSLQAALDELHLKHKEAESTYRINRQEIEDKAEEARARTSGEEFENMGKEAKSNMRWDGTFEGLEKLANN